MYEEKTPSEIRYQGALLVAQALKMFAMLGVIGGVILAIAGGIEVSEADGNVAEFIGWTFGATAGSALFFAFLGYALEVLVDIWENTFVTRMEAEDDEDDDQAPVANGKVHAHSN